MKLPKLYSTFAKYYDRLESQYRDYELEARWLADLLKDSRSVVDISCGTGNHVTRLSSLCDFDIAAMDASEEMIGVASRKEHSKRTLFLRGDFLHLPFINGSFDAAICMYWSLAGLDEAQVTRLFSEVHSVLSEDGLFIFDVENAEGIKENLLDVPFIDSFFTDEGESKAVIRANLSRKVKDDVVDWRAYYLIESGGVSELFEDRMKLRFYARNQLECLLAQSGFKVNRVLSGPWKEYQNHSPSLYVIASKQ